MECDKSARLHHDAPENDKRRPPEGDRRLFFVRAGDRTRTGDVQLGKLAFYQLNYAREALLSGR